MNRKIQWLHEFSLTIVTPPDLPGNAARTDSEAGSAEYRFARGQITQVTVTDDGKIIFDGRLEISRSARESVDFEFCG